MFKYSLKVIIIIVAFTSSAFAFKGQSTSLIKDSPKETIDQVWQIIYRDFLDYSGEYNSQDWIKLRKKLLSSKYLEKKDAYAAIRGMLSGLNDPYTRFLDPKEFNEMRIDTTGELMGVGIQISLDKETNNIIVVSPIEGTPAFQAGVKSQDIIVSIDNESTKGMSIDNAVKLIRGKKGTKVKLGLRRGDNLLKLSIIRDRIEINSVIGRLNNVNSDIKIGYIRLKQFNAKAPREMRSTINQLEIKKPIGYVLDVRSNPGGLLESSIDIAKQWVNNGIIVSTKTRDGITDIRKANGKSLTNKPLIVLVNEGSASASEILSGAIQDNNRGILIGQKTFGKGLVQSVRSLSDGSGLTVTVAKYLTPKGKDINKNGIEPDIKSELKLYKGNKLESSDLGTDKDSQYIEAQNILIKRHKESNFKSYIKNQLKTDKSLSLLTKPYQFAYNHTNPE